MWRNFPLCLVLPIITLKNIVTVPIINKCLAEWSWKMQIISYYAGCILGKSELKLGKIMLIKICIDPITKIESYCAIKKIEVLANS